MEAIADCDRRCGKQIDELRAENQKLAQAVLNVASIAGERIDALENRVKLLEGKLASG